MKNVKFLFTVVIVSLMAFVATPVNAQVSKEEKAEAKAQAKTEKTTEKILYSKSPKQVQKEAKKLEKEGWKTMNTLPIAKTLELTWEKIAERDPQTGNFRYISATQEATGNSFAAAQAQTYNLCKVRIAGQIKTVVMDETKMQIANQQLSATEAASITKVMEKATNMIAEKLGRTDNAMEIYKIVKGNYVVRTTMLYNTNQVLNQVKADALQDLQKELDNWTPTYENLLNNVIDNSKSKVNPEE